MKEAIALIHRVLIDDVGELNPVFESTRRDDRIVSVRPLEIPFRVRQDLRTVRLLKLTLLVHDHKDLCTVTRPTPRSELLLTLACVLCIPHAGAFTHNRSTANDCGKRSQHCHSIGARGD